MMFVRAFEPDFLHCHRAVRQIGRRPEWIWHDMDMCDEMQDALDHLEVFI